MYIKLPYAIGSAPSLSGHANAYRWRSLPTSLKGHYKPRKNNTHHKILLRILGAWCKSPNKCNSLQQRRPPANRMREATVRTRRLMLLRMNDHRLPKRFMAGKPENTGRRGPGGKPEIKDGLRGRGRSGVWHHGELGYRCTKHWPGVWYSIVREGGCRFMAS